MKLMTKLLSSAILLGGIVAAASPAMAYPARSESSVNVRSGPGTQYDVVGQLDPGQRVNVSGNSGGWSRIGGGWVSSNYLTASNSGPSAYTNYGASPYGPDPYSGTLFDQGSYYDDYSGPPISFGLSFGSGHGWHGGHGWHH